jgi:photosystem II stability/assembly factor-like uncharacterized protein
MSRSLAVAVILIVLVAQMACVPRAERARADAGGGAGSLQTQAVTFISPTQGWRLAIRWNGTTGAHGPMTVGRTEDGGWTWRTIGTIAGGLLREGESWTENVSGIQFVTQHDGFAYGTRLYATHDGGRTWRRLPVRGRETSLSIVGRSVWRVDTRCAGNTCRATLLTSAAGTDRWQTMDWQPPNSWRTAASLTRGDARHAWLLSGEMAAPPNHLTRRLLATDDAGKTWHALPIPCGSQGPIGDILAALGRHHLWAFCGSVPSAGWQLKTVDRSDDGGRHWRLVSASGTDGLNNISGSGYMNSAVLSSPSSAWLALGRGTLLYTADGGRTWREAIPYARANPLDGGVGPVFFLDSRHGWLFSSPSLLFRTVDAGRHWQEIHLR